MDFFTIKTKSIKSGTIEVYPDFDVGRSRDLMIRGKSFYAVWDENKHLWSTDEYDVQRLVDKELTSYGEKIASTGKDVVVRTLKNFSSNSWNQFKLYLARLSDNAYELDTKLTFANEEVTRSDHISKRLPYPLEKGPIVSWDKLITTLYEESERQKIEWAIGAIIAGDAKDIQKFLVLYGSAGEGKSTILNIIQKLFVGYYTTFESKALVSNSNSFATESFKGNPLVAIEHDGDLSRIEDNTKLNSIVAHEEMTRNEKYKPGYSAKSNCFIFIGTNKPVKITDGKSGIIRRLITVKTSGSKLPIKEYDAVMSQIDFELGAIAQHCLEVYRYLGKNFYDQYRPLDMMYQTDIFFNFVEENFFIFSQQDAVSLKQAYEMYKTYCEDSLVEFKLPRYKFREELKNYFKEFVNRIKVDGKNQRSIYYGFIKEKFLSTLTPKDEEIPFSLILDSEVSMFDKVAEEYPAQYASAFELTPVKRWINVDTKLFDLDTSLLHYVKLPINHIVIDFDLKDEKGEKSAERNLEAANKWPATYAEYSKSHKGIHLHYIYDGDPEQLTRVYSEGIEVKVFVGDSSLRRMLSKCNNVPIAHLNSGLPLKGKKMIDTKTVASERGLRDLVVRNLNKEIHPGTKPSIDFIHKILEDAYESGMKYDLTQLRSRVLAFANNSSHQAEYCVKLVGQMRFQSEDEKDPTNTEGQYASDELVFFDTEVFPNLFVVCWKYAGQDNPCVRMINPTGEELEGLMATKLVGFNCRKYDNHILYARYSGYDLTQLYELSKKLLANSPNATFGEAYKISYADIYEFSSKKQSLKKFQIDLGIRHKELGLPWDEPVPEDKWHLVAEYCDNDVISEEAVFEDRKQDFVARQILAELSGLSINDKVQNHTAKILFGKDRNQKEKFVYTDLSILFPGYTFSEGKSFYRDEDPKEGGYVYAEPGIYENVALLDIASMHPASLLALNLFGDEYTERYKELLNARLFIKHKDYASAKQLLGGKISKYLNDPGQADSLSYALKLALNIVYGETAAHHDTLFRDSRNVDNIVAKRGALFMIDLKHAVQEKGFQVAHIKTDSIKIPNATIEIIDFVFEFGKKYGYTFEHEATFSKFCLVNNAVYIAKYRDDGPDKDGEWVAVGAEFAQPFIFKTLFSKEKIVFEDLCETKSVTNPSAIYLDMNEGLNDVSAYEKELTGRMKIEEGDTKKRKSKFGDLSDQELIKLISKGHNYQFVGRVGSFCPVESRTGGGLMMREKEGSYYAVTGTKGYRWLEAEVIKELGISDQIDMSYYDALISEAEDHISKFGDFDNFVY